MPLTNSSVCHLTKRLNICHQVHGRAIVRWKVNGTYVKTLGPIKDFQIGDAKDDYVGIAKVQKSLLAGQHGLLKGPGSSSVCVFIPYISCYLRLNF